MPNPQNSEAENVLLAGALVATQNIPLEFDKDAVWNRVSGRRSVFMDTNFWIEMADEANETAVRVRDKLKELVKAGRIFCPLSWGLLEELFKQAGASLQRTASLMEELSLNAIFVMRTEVYAWELSLSMRRLAGESGLESLKGLFAPPVAFVGSTFSLSLNIPGNSLGTEIENHLNDFMKRELGKIGVVELVNLMGKSPKDETPPAYSEAAKKAKEQFKGNKKLLFLEEAGNAFQMYVRPLLLRHPLSVMTSWASQFTTPDKDEETWYLKALAELPALRNFIDIMVVASSQPTRKDKYNDFMDYEIMVAPLAYATVFASRDKNMRDLLRHRTNILKRTTCQYCDSFDALELWLASPKT